MKIQAVCFSVLTLLAATAAQAGYPYCKLIGEDTNAVKAAQEVRLTDPTTGTPNEVVRSMVIQAAHAFPAWEPLPRPKSRSYRDSLSFLKNWTVDNDVDFTTFALAKKLPDGRTQVYAIRHYPGDNEYGSIFIVVNGADMKAKAVRIASINDGEINCVK
jgi:hypothetical protein